MVLVDAHVHLTSYTDGRRAAKAAVSAGITLLSCTVDWPEAEENLSLGREFRSVRCFLGVHPSNAGAQGPSERLGGLWERADGVGEIGLDPKYSETGEGSRQRAAFEEQLGVAEKSGKPVQVHSRNCEAACLEIMGTYSLGPVLMHWFQGEGEMAEVVSRGYYVSFGPAVLFSKRLKRMAASAPQDRVLTESDGPVEFGALGGVGGPGLIPSVVFALSEIKRTAYSEMEASVERNFLAFMRAKTLNSTA